MNNLNIDDNIEIPVGCLYDKQYYIKEYCALALLSKKVNNNYRELYKKTYRTIDLAKVIGIGRTTLEKNIKILNDLKYNIFSIDNSDKGIVYRLNYNSASNKNPISAITTNYVSINSKMLSYLVCNTNSNTIKVYCILKALCNYNDYISIDNKVMVEEIGLSTNSKRNLSVITTSTKFLETNGYIETKITNIFIWDDIKGKKIPIRTKQYKLKTFEEWSIIQSNITL